jgi:putative membrane protein
VLLRLDPRWVRYAPFTATGLVAAFAIVGFLGQGTRSFVDDDAVASWATWLLTRAAWWVDVVGVLVLVCVLGTGGYLLSFWDFRLSRNRLGSLHVRRGLLTSRETSIDRNRLRGVRIGEPLGLRLAGARRLRAVSTGLSERSEGSASDWLAPPSPAAVVTELAAEVTGDRAAVGAPLEAHGPVARQRRMTRALVPTALAAVAVAGADLRFDGPLPLPVLTAVVAAVLVGAAFLGRDRYAGLGHAVTPRHIVVRSGSIARDRVVLDRAGIVGWTVRQSFFQRRAGVVTLIATTAAGQQHYDLVDLTPERAYEVVGIVSPALLAELA